MTVNPGTMPDQVVMPAQAERGLLVLVNGIPQHAQHRPLCTGDLVQLVRDPGSHSVVPATYLLRELHRLRFLALPMRMPRLQQPTAHFSEWQAQITTGLQLFFERRFIERRDVMGTPDAEHQPIYLIGPGHVPLLLQIPGRSCPSLRQAQEEVHDLGILADGTALADTYELLFTIPVFVTVPECVPHATMLAPAPGYPLDYLGFSFTRGRPTGGLRLPVDSGFFLLMPESAVDGAVAERRRGNREDLPPGAPTTLPSRHRPATSSDDARLSTGTSLVQIRATKAPRRQVIFDPDEDDNSLAPSIPGALRMDQCNSRCVATPFGRRSLPPGPAALRSELSASPSTLAAELPPPHARATIALASCLEESTDSSRPAIKFGVCADMFTHVFGDYQLTSLCADWTLMPGLPSHCRTYLSRLPIWTHGERLEAVQLYVDGSSTRLGMEGLPGQAGPSAFLALRRASGIGLALCLPLFPPTVALSLWV